jgi:hypothetical protein
MFAVYQPKMTSGAIEVYKGIAVFMTIGFIIIVGFCL